METRSRIDERGTLAAETRQTAMLLGGALGSMVLLTALLFLCTQWLAA